jgi:hypothetical protein
VEIGLGITALVALALAVDALAPVLVDRWRRRLARPRTEAELAAIDPGRERRAEQRARELLRSCVSEEDWQIYRRLGFLRVWSHSRRGRHGGPAVAYLVYPHRPIVSYVAQTGRLLHEYCVTFPAAESNGSKVLPDSDDVLAKWMALSADEQRVLRHANMSLPGKALDPVAVARNIWQLGRFERERMREVAAELAAPRQGGTASGYRRA